MKRISLKRILPGVVTAMLSLQLFGCSAPVQKVDLKEAFSWHFEGFNGAGAMATSNVSSNDFSLYLDYNNENNAQFFKNISYSPDRRYPLTNGETITVTVDCNEELARKAGLELVNTQFTIPVSDLPDLVLGHSQLSDAQKSSLLQLSREHLDDNLSSSWGSFVPDGVLYTTEVDILPDTVDYLGSCVFSHSPDADWMEWSSYFTSLYCARVSSAMEELDNRYCYMITWIPQNSRTGDYELDGGYGYNFETEMAGTVDRHLTEQDLIKLRTSSAEMALDHGKGLDEEALYSIMLDLLPKQVSQYSVLPVENYNVLTLEEVASTAGETHTALETMLTEITWSAGQEIVMVDEVCIRSEETMTWATLGCVDETDAGDSYTLQAVEQGVGVSAKEFFGKIGDNQWIKLEDSDYYYALPKDVYDSYIGRKDWRVSKKEFSQ